MRTTSRLVVAALIAGSLAMSGCAYNSSSADVYTASQAQREETVRMGTVDSVRAVKISSNNGQPSGLGAIGGGALGAVAGSAIGGGRGSIVTASSAAWLAQWQAMRSRTASRYTTVSRSPCDSITAICAPSRKAPPARSSAPATACDCSPAAASRASRTKFPLSRGRASRAATATSNACPPLCMRFFSPVGFEVVR